MLAIGQTLIILTAGIDLSVGAVMALGPIVMTKLAVDSGVPPLLAILLGILRRASAFGLLNGGLVTRLALPPFIVTLGHAQHRLRADAHLLERPDDHRTSRASCSSSGKTFTIGGTDVHLRRRAHARAVRDRLVRADADAWGRHVYAVGDNPEAARLTGIQHATASCSASTSSPA